MFCILDYIDDLQTYGAIKEYPTWIYATCPNCGGKLKISTTPLKYGSYACYTTECHKEYPNPIKQILYKKTAFNGSTSFDYTTSVRKLPVYYPPHNNFSNFNLEAIVCDVPFSKPVQNKVPGKLYTEFAYEDFKVVRIDYLEESKSKDIFFSYLDSITGQYVTGIPPLKRLPIYRSEYLGESVLFLEGEPCATIAQKLGLRGITIPSFIYNEQYLDRVFFSLSQSVKHMIIFPDNDEAGITKQGTIERYCWKYRINTLSISIVAHYPKYKYIKGYDLYDLYLDENINQSDILTLIQSSLP